MVAYFAQSALLPNGWHRNVRVEVDQGGKIAAVQADAGASGASILRGPVIPGIPNVHSHAFQRAMAGTAERKTAERDSFWTWREQMYRVALSISPDQLEAVAGQLFVELLKAGYTSIAEFHYVHHDPAGHRYADPAELAHRILAAAALTGIRLTLLPVIYAYSGFGQQPLEPGQRRFRADPAFAFELLDAVRPTIIANPLFTSGIAPHSLRAVSTEMLREITSAYPAGMIHIHVAEQQPEIAASLAATGRRSIELLADTVDLSERWCLIHATHANDSEIETMARSGAVIGLCPTTEANLGDGFFNLPAYQAQGGKISIGTDSNICASAAEELRTLEYAQRLLRQSRCVTGQASNGRALLDAVLAGGRQAVDQPVGRIEVGSHADLCVLDITGAALPGMTEDALLDQFVFASRSSMMRDVMVGGLWVISDGRHALEEDITSRFNTAIGQLRQQAY